MRKVVPFFIMLLMTSTPALAHQKGEVLNLTPDAAVVLKSETLKLRLVRQMDTLPGNIEVWAAQPQLEDPKAFSPLRIVYFLPDGRMLAGHIFDRQMRPLTIRYAVRLQKRIERRLLPLDDALAIPAGGHDTEFERMALIVSDSDDWIRQARMMIEAIEKDESLRHIPWTIYYLPTGDAEHIPASARAWQGAGADWMRQFIRNGGAPDELTQQASSLSDAASARLRSIIEKANKAVNRLGVPAVGTYVLYQGHSFTIPEDADTAGLATILRYGKR